MRVKIYLGIILFSFIPLIGWAADFSQDLYFGLKNNSEVTSLQGFLHDQNLYGGPITGNFFALTREGVKKFQEREGIKPVSGYFGPKTRSRANTLLTSVQTPVQNQNDAASIAAQIQALRARIQALQQSASQPASTTIAATATTTATTTVVTTPPISFTKLPSVSQAGLVDNSPLGFHYPYKVVFDWAVNETGYLNEAVTCTPGLKIGKSAGRLTDYYPEPNTSYSCQVNVADQNNNKTSASFTFSSPSWVSIAGSSTQPFPSVETSPLKIGDISIYNGTTTDVLFTRFDTAVSDEMDSTPNRNRRVSFVIRDGPNATDPLISSTFFTFFAGLPIPPQVGSPYIAPVSLPFSVTVPAGQERKVSLWIENMAYVKSGALKIYSTGILTSSSVTGSFNFVLTQPPAL